MNQSLNEFLKVLQKDKSVKKEFGSCKTLKESHEKFMRGKCSYEDYEQFFKDFVREKSQISEENLTKVSGGVSLKNLLTPLAILTMLTGLGTISNQFASAEGGPGDAAVQPQEADHAPEEGEIDGVRYKIEGGVIELSGNESSPLTGLIIPEELRDRHMGFRIGKGIHSIALQGDEKLAGLAVGAAIQSIDATQSTRYIADELALYEKGLQGQRGRLVGVYKSRGTINNRLNYTILGGRGAIVLTGPRDRTIENVVIPHALRQFGLKFHIGPNIESIILMGNEEIDISNARSLKSIDVDSSSRYAIKNGHLCNKDGSGDFGKVYRNVDIVDFCLECMAQLPTESDELRPYLELLDERKLKENREDEITHVDGSTEAITINEKEVYQQIKATVDELIRKVEGRTPNTKNPKTIAKRTAAGTWSKNHSRDKTWRIAKAIYRWVAKHISGDDENEDHIQLKKPQDPLFVYSQKMGVCAGCSHLLNLMMRMANIPSCLIGSIPDNEGGALHAYSAIFLPADGDKLGGWTLLDATWGAPDDSPFNKQGEKIRVLDTKEKFRIQQYFPGFYNKDIETIEDGNKKILHEESHKIERVAGFDVEPIMKFKIGKLNYSLSGSADDPVIALTGPADPGHFLEDLEIPQQLMKYGYRFKIYNGIKSITLQGDEEIDIDGAISLSSIDATQSSKYIVRDGHLYTNDGQTDLGVIDKAGIEAAANAYRNSLPKERSQVQQYVVAWDESKLDKNRHVKIINDDGSTQEIISNEEKCYQYLKNEVKKFGIPDYTSFGTNIIVSILQWINENTDYKLFEPIKNTPQDVPLPFIKPNDKLICNSDSFDAIDLAVMMFRLCGIPCTRFERSNHIAAYMPIEGESKGTWRMMSALAM
ncbi:MAG: transglutaminase domain-containing protein [Clostridia bacterium]|nr:transglutaminase domain-containing protein [Clostridia bacterium]